MTNLNKENLLSAGGNEWAKGNASRVYLNDESIAKAFDLKLSETARFLGQFKSIGKAKVWFNCKTETLHSDKGMVRVMFNSNHIKCSK